MFHRHALLTKPIKGRGQKLKYVLARKGEGYLYYSTSEEIRKDSVHTEWLHSLSAERKSLT